MRRQPDESPMLRNKRTFVKLERWFDYGEFNPIHVVIFGKGACEPLARKWVRGVGFGSAPGAGCSLVGRRPRHQHQQEETGVPRFSSRPQGRPIQRGRLVISNLGYALEGQIARPCQPA